MAGQIKRVGSQSMCKHSVVEYNDGWDVNCGGLGRRLRVGSGDDVFITMWQWCHY